MRDSQRKWKCGMEKPLIGSDTASGKSKAWRLELKVEDSFRSRLKATDK